MVSRNYRINELLHKVIRLKSLRLNAYTWGFISTLYIMVLGNRQNVMLSIIGIAMYCLLVTKPTCLIGPILLTTIHDNYLLAFNGQSFSRYIVTIYIIGVLLHKIKSTKTADRFSDHIVLLITIIVLSFVFSLFTPFTTGVQLPIVFVLNVGLAITMALSCHSDGYRLFIQIKWYTILAVFYLIYIFVFNKTVVENLYGAYSIEQVNQNQFALNTTVCACILFGIFLASSFRSKVIYTSLMLSLLIIVILTGARTSAIALILSIAVMVYISMKTDKKSHKRLLWRTIVMSISIVLIFYILNILYPQLMVRFTLSNVMANQATHRFDIWSIYFSKLFPIYWFAGLGFDPVNMYNAIAVLYGRGHGAHNMIIDILASAGVVGLLLFGMLFRKIALLIKQNLRNGNLIMFIPCAMLMGLLFEGLGENIIRSRQLWIAIGLCYSLSYTKQSPEVINECIE